MKSWTTKNGHQIYRVLSGRSNAYLVVKDNRCLLVDTGKESGYSRMVENIKQTGFKISDIEYLVLTHTHFDHCQSAFRIKKESGCKIIVSENAREYVANGFTKLPNGTIFLTRQISRIGKKIGKRHFGYHSFQPDNLVSRDNNFRIDSFDIDIIHTTGHSEESVSILIDNEIALVGDVMFGVVKNAVFPPYADDVETMIKSWKKLLGTRCQLFLPGHGNEINRRLLEKEYEKYVKAGNIR